MSVEGTNTPNGDGNKKDLYSSNPDKVILTYIDCNAIGENDLANWQKPGDGIEAEESREVDVSNAIEENGSVRIGTVPVGQPMIASPEAKGSIKAAIEEVKKATLARKGAITYQAYVDMLKKRIEAKTKKAKEESDGIGENDIKT